MMSLASEIPILRVKNMVNLQTSCGEAAEFSTQRCIYCNKTFGSYGYRKRHEVNHCTLNPQKIHEKEIKSYSCEICSISYSNKCSLSTHRKYNCGPSHICNICGKIYSEICNLKRHLRNDHAV